MCKANIVVVILFLSIDALLSANAYNTSDYGLFIKSAPDENSQKTSLILENDSPIKLKKETTISFELFMREDYVFGIVSRMITNKKENIDFLFTINDAKYHPLLIVNETAHTLPVDLIREQWVPISITLAIGQNKILLNYGDQQLSVFHKFKQGTSDMKVSFGVSHFESFVSTDIASVNIKNIKVFENGKLKRYWKLNEQHQQNGVLDSVANVPAKVINPQWIIDMYSTWNKIYSDITPFMTQIAFDQRDKFYIVSPDSKNITVFNTIDRTKENIQVAGNGCMAANSPNRIFFDTLSNQLVTYNLEELFVSEYSLETNTWSSQTKPTSDPSLNNSVVYMPSDNVLYFFGGYAYHRYNNVLTRTNRSGNIQKRIELVEIPPRYSTSTAIADNTMYIFGGRGSKSGRQEIAPRNYYDLYAVDLLMLQPTKLWEEEEVTKDFLPGENMIFDPENNCFYVFTTFEGGTLLKLKTNEKGFTQMSLPIGDNLESYLYLGTNLYFSSSQQKLYALIYKKTTNEEVNVSIYSLDYPPVPVVCLKKEFTKNQSPVALLFSICILLGVIVITLSTFLYKKKKKEKRLGQITIKHNEETKIQENHYYDFSKSAICFLNGFNVVDKSGNNITKQFTPTLKHLLILLVLNTEKDERGIFGKKLIQLLWFDKDEEAAKNNRNVYLSKLRSVLENVGEVKIITKNNYWTIEFDQNITCDYTETMQLFRAIGKEQTHKDQILINKLLELLLKGVLLPNTEIDWLDNFKSDFSNLTIDILIRLSCESGLQLTDELKLKIADTIFLHDLINEEALSLKCSTLFNSGKKGLAQTVYNTFCKEYYHLLGVTYKYSLSDVIARKHIR